MLAKVETRPSRLAFVPSSVDPRPSAALKRTLFPVMPRVFDATQFSCCFPLLPSTVSAFEFSRTIHHLMACRVHWPFLWHTVILLRMTSL